MKNMVRKGDTVRVVAPAAVSSGDPVLVGAALFGVACHDAANGAELELAVEGEFDLPKDTNLVIAAGDRLFWDAANRWLDKTATAQMPVAIATRSASQAATTVRCRLTPSAPAGA